MAHRQRLLSQQRAAAQRHLLLLDNAARLRVSMTQHTWMVLEVVAALIAADLRACTLPCFCVLRHSCCRSVLNCKSTCSADPVLNRFTNDMQGRGVHSVNRFGKAHLPARDGGRAVQAGHLPDAQDPGGDRAVRRHGPRLLHARLHHRRPRGEQGLPTFVEHGLQCLHTVADRACLCSAGRLGTCVRFSIRSCLQKHALGRVPSSTTSVMSTIIMIRLAC